MEAELKIGPDPELIADCVHCGFCLPTCPTYELWHEEMDSPRGRIHLMAALQDGSLELTDVVVEHFDRCLGCMACVTACPSGVQYDRLIEQTRALVEERTTRPLRERLLRSAIFAVLPHRRRLRLALALRLAVAELDRGLGLDDVVDARAAAADVGLAGLEQRKPRHLREHRARLSDEALRVAQVTGVLEGDGDLERVAPRERRRDELGDVD